LTDFDSSDKTTFKKVQLMSIMRTTRAKWTFGFVVLIALFMWFIPWAPILMMDTIEVERLDAKGNTIVVEVGRGTKNWTPIERISKHLIHAVISAEDAKFYDHYGFDFVAIKHAYELNKKKGRFVRGGSTISQQVVKMAFLTREKTYIRKIREAFGTAFMELILPKERILEWYLNLTEFGGGIYGVKQAGSFYFKTKPELLTTEQSIHLAVVIPSPNKWSKGLRQRNLTPFGQKRFARIAMLLRKSGYIGENQVQLLLSQGNFGRPLAGFERVVQLSDQLENEDLDECQAGEDCDTSSDQKEVQPVEKSNAAEQESQLNAIKEQQQKLLKEVKKDSTE
jgi:monofunctional biosynthetic peptidoglycan transglycosylase